MTNHSDKALIIFAKSPFHGHVKTRLTPPLTPEQAAGLYEAIMLDGIDLYLSVHDTHLLLFASCKDDLDYFRERFPEMTLFVQEGETLGERMSDAFNEAFAQGHRRVMLFGTDLPTMPLRNIYSGFQLLDAFDDAVVIGPTEDGGYYTIGMKMPMPEIFQGVTFSRIDTYDQTIKRICKLDVALYVLPPWYDIDTIADVRRLDNDLYNPEFSDNILFRTKQYMRYLRECNIIPRSRRKAK